MDFPASTYRLQFTPSFGFQAAKRILPYLARLGISTIYASPIFQARRGSAHGYDVVDPNSINADLGSQADFAELAQEVRRRGMGWLQDFVPNHMAYHSDNRMLMDIFEKGPSSPYISFFDVEWDHPRLNLRGKLIAPFLARPYAETLERDELRLDYDEGGLGVRYYEHRYPIRIESYATFLSRLLDVMRDRLTKDDSGKVVALLRLVEGLHLEDGPSSRNARIDQVKELLRELFTTKPGFRDSVEETVAGFNREIDWLDRLLQEQWFLFTYWRLASKEINYQRFFNINELISIRVEDEKVFYRVHGLVLKLLAEGKITGLRIDHVDGLYNPVDYLVRLREACSGSYIVVEKILETSESLPARWPVEGTTGYDFLNGVNEVFVDSTGEAAFDRVYREFAGVSFDWEQLVYEKKKLIVERHLTGDLDNLAYLLKRVSTTTREGIDLTTEGLKKAVIEFSAVFPVYRTYINRDTITERDRRYVHDAIAKAKELNPEPARELAFLEKVLLLEIPAHIADEDRALWLSFVMRFQQFTSPLMAKGLEDTALYVYNRLASLNEVGGNPSRFGASIEDFHAFNQRRLEATPHTLNATSTHDAKRGEDVRARIDVLSEMPGEWESHVRLWHRQNLAFKNTVDGSEVPDNNEEYLLYQTLLGSMPFGEFDHTAFAGRISAYMTKAAREAKIHTSWQEPDGGYEDALSQFVGAIVEEPASESFLKTFVPFQQKVGYFGMLNSLSQTLLKMTSPGVPDFYQGTELWDFRLVDPDNRRSVDFERREALLADIEERETTGLNELIRDLLSSMQDGRVKLFTIRRALKARLADRELFGRGDYIPLDVRGDRRLHVVAFARRWRDRWAVVVVPRLMVSLVKPRELPVGEQVWGETEVSLTADMPSAWRHIFTGEELTCDGGLPAAAVFGSYPLGFLIGKQD